MLPSGIYWTSTRRLSASKARIAQIARTFSKHLFDGDDVEVVESDAETEEFPATVSDAGMHLSDRFAMHEKYGFPEALLTFRGLWEAKDNTKNNLDESWTRSKSNTSTFSQGTFQ